MAHSRSSFLLFALLGLGAFVEAAAPPDLEGQIDTRLEGDGRFRNRVSATVASPIGPLSAFLEEQSEGGRLILPVAGLTTPPFDLGPLREEGLIRELDHPFGLGSIRERSGVALDRSFGSTGSPGGVVRLDSQELGGGRVEIYAFRRAGSAPAQTSSGGLSFVSPAGGTMGLDLAAKLTSFGAEGAPGEWLTVRPAVRPPVVVKGGARLSGGRGGFRGSLSSGVSLSDHLRPASFCSGFLACDASLPSVQGGAPSLFLSGRIDGGFADPYYYGDDGRFALKTALIRPALSLRLPGFAANGSYGLTLYRPPLLPARYRRSSHDAALDVVVGFGPLSVGGSLRPRLEYTEEGRTLLREVTTLNTELAFGPIAIRSEIDFHHSNDSPETTTGGLYLRTNGKRVSLDLALTRREGAWSAGTNATLLREHGALHLGAAFTDLAPFDPRGGRLAPRWGEAMRRCEITISWQARSR